MKVKFSAIDYPSIRSLSVGDEVNITIKGKVGNRFISSMDDFAEIEINNLEAQRQRDNRLPGEIMKDIAQLQGMINTPTP